MFADATRRAAGGGRRAGIEQAVRDAAALAQQAAIAAAERARPQIREAARVAARRLDPSVVMKERYAHSLRALVEAIHEDGSITYDPALTGYVMESGTNTGKMTTGISFSDRLSEALEEAADVLRADASDIENDSDGRAHP